MPDHVTGPRQLTVEELAYAIRDRLRTGGDKDAGVHALEALSAVADATGTHPEGVATALTLFRSNLCGAAQVLPHVEAERDQLKAMVAGLETGFVEYGVEVNEHGRWSTVLTIHGARNEDPHVMLAGLDDARSKYPGTLYRLVARRITAWAPVDEHTIRAAADTQHQSPPPGSDETTTEEGRTPR